MIYGKSVSVILTTYIRYDGLDSIIKAWLRQPIDQLWVLDGGGTFNTDIKDDRMAVFNMPKDLGNGMDYAFGLLTSGDMIILADDDVIVRDSFTSDLFMCQAMQGGIVGIIGRKFHGPEYYRDTEFFKSCHINNPVKVGFVGVVIMTPREYLGFDIRGLSRNCDDLWWQMKMRPDLDKWVAPTKAYADTLHSVDSTSLSSNLSLRKERADFYREHYLNNKRVGMKR